MEAFLFSLDILFLIWLILRVGKVYQSGDANDLGIFRYHEQRKDAERDPVTQAEDRNA